MSDTHVNAYALELEEKRKQRTTLDGEIDSLEKVVKSMTPDEDVPKPKKQNDSKLKPKNVPVSDVPNANSSSKTGSK